ncbi:hypothetical protein HPO96_06170 [Kribbella sandramycini]|uniref:Uncharacterized protein n=1 Tax=Kribbella sandramycini TaxID=60450 RepID=A0A7Y4KW62_9ACTN|nr:hypothetical protein [Kribbella sandramycini]MBB6567572.1 hypothetical protein [Kribbella sandramycini]NOL39824.1 hypothetical protein [Kribbella sandramycini]
MQSFLPYPDFAATAAVSRSAQPGRRWGADTCRTTMLADLRTARDIGVPRNQAELTRAGATPPWLGDDAVHRSHRSALLRKDPGYYAQYFDEPADLPYVWPASDRSVGGEAGE